MKVEWLGKELKSKIEAAEKAALDATTEAAAKRAEENHWWRNRTGNLEANIESVPATMNDAGQLEGKFGVTGPSSPTWIEKEGKSGFYGLFLERRTPFLLPAYDEEFPELPRRIKEALDAGSA